MEQLAFHLSARVTTALATKPDTVSICPRDVNHVEKPSRKEIARTPWFSRGWFSQLVSHIPYAKGHVRHSLRLDHV